MIIAFALSSQLIFASGNSKKNTSGSNSMAIEYMNFEISDEISLEIIEDWMVDLTHWDFMTDGNEEIYSTTEIEKWMLDVGRWSQSNNILAEESETIENWMKDPCHWNFSGVDYCESTPEIDYQLQGWMTNPYYFQI
jgi:hypothetical protein